MQCFKSAWLYAFLHDGLKFPLNYQHLQSASLINNNDVQWTLGAILYRTRFFPLKSVYLYCPYLSDSTLILLEQSMGRKILHSIADHTQI